MQGKIAESRLKPKKQRNKVMQNAKWELTA